MTTQMGKPDIEPFATDDIMIPNEKVGCTFVTMRLQEFLEEYPPSSDKQAFLNIFHMLSLLDRYLYDNPRQHIYCMSLDNEYVTLLYHEMCLHIDIRTFTTVWAVLSFLLDTQDNNLEYVKFLQEEYNRYYEYRMREYMEKLEKKSVAIQTRMYDSVAPDFDRVSDYHDNGSTPLQGQQDEQPEAVNGAENAIEHDAIGIMAEYPPWSTETHDRNRKEIQNDKAIYDRNRKEIQSELFKDTPVKTEDNKPYIDNIEAYNRDRAQITQSLNDRSGLGQNSLLGAHQVRVATKHTKQMTNIPEHLRWISLGEEIESITDKGVDRNSHIIPQLDSTIDSRGSLNGTLDNVDLTTSPEKHRNEQTDRVKTNEDTNDNYTDNIVKFNKDKARKGNAKDRNEQRDTEKADEDTNDDIYESVKFNKGKATKEYEINTEKEKILKERREKALQNAKNRDAEKANI